MKEQHKKVIRGYLKDGFTVEVVNPDGVAFRDIYKVIRKLSTKHDKAVLIKEDGTCFALQG